MLQNTQLKTVDIKLNQLTELPANWVSGVGIPDDAQLVNFRASFNLLSVCCFSLAHICSPAAACGMHILCDS